MRSNNDIIVILTLKSSVGQCYIQVTSNLNMSQQFNVFKQQYYWNFNNLNFCRSVLHSGNVQSEYFAAVESVQTTIIGKLTL